MWPWYQSVISYWCFLDSDTERSFAIEVELFPVFLFTELCSAPYHGFHFLSSSFGAKTFLKINITWPRYLTFRFPRVLWWFLLPRFLYSAGNGSILVTIWICLQFRNSPSFVVGLNKAVFRGLNCRFSGLCVNSFALAMISSWYLIIIIPPRKICAVFTLTRVFPCVLFS